MSRREVIAYAITHAPPGQEGGPYTGNGSTAHQVPSMALARRYALDDLHEAQADVAWLVRNEYTARVIRIVRARPSPSEASAVEVLREVASYPGNGGDLARIQARARAVLAASGPDPMPVVRAAMEETDAEEAFSAAPHCGRRGEAAALDAAARARVDAVDAYREAGGK